MTTTREEQRDVARDLLSTLAEWHSTIRMWSGSAFVAGEDIGDDAGARKQLYLDLCRIGNETAWMEDEITRLRASQAGGVPAGWALIPIEPDENFFEAAAYEYCRSQGADPEQMTYTTSGGIQEPYGPAWVHCLGDVKDAHRAMLSASPPPPATDGGLTIADYERAFEDHKRLVRRLDVLLNGEAGAAPQASLCDIVGQLEGAKRNAVPATDGDALREALRGSMHALQALLNAVKTNPAMQGRQYIDLGIQVNTAIDKARNALASSPPPVPEIVAPQVVSDATADTGSASAAHLEQILPSPDLGQAAELVKPQCDNPSPAALASVPTPVSDGDSVLRKAVALVITHHVNQNRQKRRPESDSFTLKTLREALAATPVSATDAVEAERAIIAAAVREFAQPAPPPTDVPDPQYIKGFYEGQNSTVECIEAMIIARGTDEVENG